MNISALLPDASRPLSTLSWLTGLRHVAENTAVTVRRLGRFHRTLGPGWHWTLPALDNVGEPVPLVGHHLDVAGAACRAELYYQILEPARAGRALEDVDGYVAAETRDALAATGDAGRLKDALNTRLAGTGLRVIRCVLHPA